MITGKNGYLSVSWIATLSFKKRLVKTEHVFTLLWQRSGTRSAPWITQYWRRARPWWPFHWIPFSSVVRKCWNMWIRGVASKCLLFHPRGRVTSSYLFTWKSWPKILFHENHLTDQGAALQLQCPRNPSSKVKTSRLLSVAFCAAELHYYHTFSIQRRQYTWRRSLFGCGESHGKVQVGKSACPNVERLVLTRNSPGPWRYHFSTN